MPAFLDQYEGAIHHRKDFDKVTNFVHSRSCLSGKALQFVNSLTITAENYEASQLKGTTKLHDEINSQLLEICALRRNINTSNTKLISGFWMLLPKLVKLLPTQTRTKWKEHSAKLKEEQVTSQIFLTILSQQVLCMDNTDSSANRKKQSSPARHNVQRQPRRHTTIDGLPTMLTIKGAVCQSKHHVTNCLQLLDQELEERKETARILYPCFRCLREGHRATEYRLKNQCWDLHHLLTSTSSNQLAER
ncbi:hypothetical protein T12_8498 [Trichinella patagoniensis]|uniref:Uncharacterized protein n=1 Tax=Trichinella patagoniensis TaxID=990121 RepID=A0A0V0ZUB5_9BILA|nr:hypothetical protein T12_8498 [Trichinella patagoniensis]